MSNLGGNGGTEVKTGQSSVKPSTGGGGPIIEESQESEEYQQDLQVVVGTTIGVIAIVGLVVVGIFLYRVYRARQRALAYSHQNDDSFDRNISLDVGEKCQPVVFLLYANDCQLHQRVVEALAGFLMEVCGVTVTLDLLEEADIIDRGIDDWLVDRLQEADYIMVMCSLGARLRCSKKHVRFKRIGQQLLPDYFSVAVDYVSEKMRVEKQKGLSTDKFLVVHMDYSTQSDIPPQLETASRFCLMKDIHKLHTHLKTFGPESVKSDNGSQQSDCELHYHETETGAILKATIEQTKTYFKENPSWMDDRLEPTSAGPLWVGKSRKRQHSSQEQPLLHLTDSLTVQSAHKYDLNQQQSTQRWSSKLSGGFDVANQSTSSMYDNKGHRTGSSNINIGLSKSGVFGGRQNSLPTSLASSGLIVPPKNCHVSKSMDNFNSDPRERRDHDGVPCLFCGSCHMEGVPECKLLDAPSSMPQYLNQEDSMHNLYSSLNNFSHSQTVLQAEVHQEWGTPVKTHQKDSSNNSKSITLGRDLRHWDSDRDLTPLSPPVYQSLPPNHPSPNIVSDWECVGQLRKWDGPVPESLDVRGKNENLNRQFCHGRTLSQSSVLTNESESASDTDSLKRDLHSIQNICSFQDFVNSSLFISAPRASERMPSPYLLPSLNSSHILKSFPNFGQSENQRNGDVGVEIEMNQIELEQQV